MNYLCIYLLKSTINLREFYAIEGISVKLWFSGGYLLHHSKEKLRKNILIISHFLEISQIMNSKIDRLKININEPIEEIIF